MLKIILLSLLSISTICADVAMRTLPSTLKKSSPKSYHSVYQLQHTAPCDYTVLSSKLPCQKCKILSMDHSASLMLIASQEDDLKILEEWVSLIDQPKENLTITVYCLVVQEHEIDNFLSTLLYQSQSLVKAWKEGLVSLLLEMERKHGITLIACPRMVLEIGRTSSLRMQDDFRIAAGQNQEGKMIDLMLNLEAHRQGSENFLLSIDFSQKMTSRSAQHSSLPNQSNSLKTRSAIKRNEVVFLGSAGQWSWVRDQGSLSLLKILPEALTPFFYQDQGSKSQLIILAECH